MVPIRSVGALAEPAAGAAFHTWAMSCCCFLFNTGKSRIQKFLKSQSERTFTRPETPTNLRSPPTESIRIVPFLTRLLKNTRNLH